MEATLYSNNENRAVTKPIIDCVPETNVAEKPVRDELSRITPY